MKIKMALLPLLMAVFALGGCEQTNRKDVTFTVDSKESRIVGSGDSRKSVFFVYGTRGEVFRNEDVLINLDGKSKFDSASMQAMFKPGKTYEVETIGWRIPFLSMFPNIVEATEFATPIANDASLTILRLDRNPELRVEQKFS
jgi:hypothetical protein